MIINDFGKIVEFTWFDLPNHNKNISMDLFIIMPNHVHGIIEIVGAGSKPALVVNDGARKHRNNFKNLSYIYQQEQSLSNRAGLEPAPTINKSLPEIVRQFKTFSARRINKKRNKTGVSVWQRNYYEHIIRHDDELNLIRQYIINNPSKWREDENNPRIINEHQKG